MKAIVFCAMGAAAVLAVCDAAVAADFYAGKTVTFMNGAEAGGSSSISCRMLGEHLQRVIPGNPKFIVKNMPSESGIAANNFVGLQVKKDGLTMTCGAYGPAFQLFGEPNLKVDLTKFNIISGNGDSDVLYMSSDVAPGLKTGEDIFSLPPGKLTFGGIAYNTQKDVKARAILKAYGIDNYKYVTGFNGDSAGRAAIQQKFIGLYTEAANAYIGITANALVKTGQAIPVAQSGQLDESGKRIRDPRMPDIPTYAELYEKHFGKPATGLLWDLIATISAHQNVAGRWVALPPDSPPEAIAIMRKAIDDLNKDPAFLADAAKLRGEGIAAKEWPGAIVQARLDAYLHMPPEMLKLFNELVEEGDKRQTNAK